MAKDQQSKRGTGGIKKMDSDQDRENTMEGHLIRQAIGYFYAERSMENLLVALNVLQDSLVWIPCSTETGDAEENQQEEPHLVPDTLKSDSGYFFPVFSSREEMGEYGEKFSNIQKTFPEAILLARGNQTYPLSGIVVDAFTTPFSLTWDMLDMIEEGANTP